ncbi:MAG: TIGR00730 family Rossman fold protein [Flavobacteriaceae bacterium]|nr:TIGR00730 family Rossman fold protein [Bacteroidia bacterium]MBT8288245.1 TIGR00730 family Rossman fold protein [Bacteroidia bacterium]NNF74789.1 TIGR00730 family Rossman fold protein [Flavobacteriaceae bacterium]NNK74180.1 TIGR00730 family Rossman fold protein [Flavobacteriaceae bacterium]
MKSVAVFCGSSEGNDQRIIDTAYKLGQILACEGLSLVYGAAKIGLMGQVARGAIEKDGKIIGVIPDFLQNKEIVSDGLSELIITKNMHDRKVIMYDRSDGFLIIPGGFGTMDELFEIATWGQLGLHTKPIGILNVQGYYDNMISQFKVMVHHGILKQENLDALLVDRDIDKLLNKMKNFIPRPQPKWLDKDRL